MNSIFIIQIVISVFAILMYFFLVFGYQRWLWKSGMDGFRKWLEKKLGYAISVVPGFRSISWKTTPEAPFKTKVYLMIVSNTFFLLTGLLPIFLLAVVTLLVFLGDALLH